MIDSLLQKFYSALQTKDGKDYSKPSLVGLRAGINRHLNGAPHCRTISIMKDREFMTSNQVLNGLVKKLKREGKDFSVNKEPVSSADMQKFMMLDCLLLIGLILCKTKFCSTLSAFLVEGVVKDLLLFEKIHLLKPKTQKGISILK